MKTAKGNNYENLLAVFVTDTTLRVNKKFAQLSDINTDAEYIATMCKTISEIIQAEKRGSGVFAKQLERIELHREQLLDALGILFTSYKGLSTPQTRQSPIDKARSEMLLSITDNKMLRAMAAMHLGDSADSYILPDDRKKLVSDTVAAMKRKEPVATA